MRQYILFRTMRHEQIQPPLLPAWPSTFFQNSLTKPPQDTNKKWNTEHEKQGRVVAHSYILWACYWWRLWDSHAGKDADDGIVLGCDAVYTRRQITAFQRNIPCPSSGLKWRYTFTKINSLRPFREIIVTYADNRRKFVKTDGTHSYHCVLKS
jgi:hypothetical protein